MGVNSCRRNGSAEEAVVGACGADGVLCAASGIGAIVADSVGKTCLTVHDRDRLGGTCVE